MDLNSAFETVAQAIDGSFDLFDKFPTELTMFLVGLTLFIVFCRLVLFPLFGASSLGRGSDSVSHRKEVDE